MDNEYREEQYRLEAKAKSDYAKLRETLTPEQRALCDQTMREMHNDTKPKIVCGVQHVDSHLSITKAEGKQEPHCKKLFYGETGQPDFTDSIKENFTDSREDIVLDCVGFIGQLDVVKRKNLKRLLRDFDLQAIRSCEEQSFTKFALLIHQSKNPKLEIQNILKAAGIDVGESGERTARQYGVTRQSISKGIQKEKRKLGLPDETRDSKKTESKETYRNGNNKNFNFTEKASLRSEKPKTKRKKTK